MIPWIQVYSNLPRHPKTTKLADELGLSGAVLNPNVVAVGVLVSLWAWAIQNAYDGNLSGCSYRAIADACTWKKKPEILIKALQHAGFLDENMCLHDWEEYACLLVEQEENRKAKTRDRVQRYREKKSAASNTSVTLQSVACNVTDTQCNAPTIPDLTIPNHNSGGGGDIARARGAVDEYCAARSIDADAFIGRTPENKAEAEALTDELFAKFVGRKPLGTDYVSVYLSVYAADRDGNIAADENRRDLLCYAFEAAANVGKPGDWSYIRGVLKRMQGRGIKTLADAEDYDWQRA